MMKKLTKIFTTMILLVITLVPVFAFEDEKIYDSVEQITEPGQYRIRIYYIDDNGLENSDIITLTITENDLTQTSNPSIKPTLELQTETQELSDITEVIVASNIEITLGTFDRLTDQRLIELAHAKAWVKETGEVIPIPKVVKEQNGDSITVTFETSNHTSIKVKVLEVSEKKATWAAVNRDVSSNGEENPFQTINATSITITVMVLLLIPLLIIILIYLYIQKQFKNVDELLYQDSKKNQNP